MTGKQVWDKALQLLDEPDSTEYDRYALTMINAIQNELAAKGIGFTKEGVPKQIAALSETMEIDELTAQAVLVYGVTALLSTNADKKMTNYFEQKYESAKADAVRSAPVSISVMQDVYPDGGSCTRW
ncbi:MAG: hypothetical protein EOM69_05850 [Clostridia bacterium]|nr:hypothetical protein [Clostridia bacterium]